MGVTLIHNEVPSFCQSCHTLSPSNCQLPLATSHQQFVSNQTTKTKTMATLAMTMTMTLCGSSYGTWCTTSPALFPPAPSDPLLVATRHSHCAQSVLPCPACLLAFQPRLPTYCSQSQYLNLTIFLSPCVCVCVFVLELPKVLLCSAFSLPSLIKVALQLLICSSSCSCRALPFPLLTLLYLQVLCYSGQMS